MSSSLVQNCGVDCGPNCGADCGSYKIFRKPEIYAIATMSEMECWDLAPGDTISQDGSLRTFRYSQFSACPSAPFNTAMPECLPSQFHLSASFATSPLLEFEDHNPGPLGEPSSSLLNSSTKSDAFAEDEKCDSECAEHLPHGESFSDSLGLSLFDASSWAKKCENSPRRACCDHKMLEEEAQVSNVGVSVAAQQASPVHSPIQDSPRRVYCDSRFLDEETQVLDVGLLSSNQQASYPLSPKQPLQSAPQAFDPGYAVSEISATVLRKEKTAAEPKKSLPLLAVKQGCRAVEDFDDICQRWHSRRTAPVATALSSSSAGIGLPSETQLDLIRPRTSHALDYDHFRGQPTGLEPVNPAFFSASQMASAAVEEDADIVPKSHDRKRITLSAYIKRNSLANIGLPLKPKQETIQPSTSDADHFRGQPTFLDPENVSPSTATNQDIVAVVDDADIVRRWHNRKRIALSALSNLSSSPDNDPCKKLKQTPENVVESGTAHSGLLQSQLVDDENWSVPRYGHARPEKDTISPRGGSEMTEEDVNVNDDADDCCDSKLLHRKLKYSCARSFKSFFQVVTPRHEPSIAISSSNEFGVSKPEHAEKKWTYPRKNRPGGRQRTMDSWIK